MNTAVKQLRYEAGPWLRGGSAFSAASHRCTSSGIPTTILSPLPITPDPRTHLGARANGPHKTTAPMSRFAIPPRTHLGAWASGPPKITAPTSRWVIPPRTHLGAWASGPPKTTAPMSRWVIPPRTHLGAWASGPPKTTAPMSRWVIPPCTHLGAWASGPPKTTAPMSRWVIPPRTHLGAWASGPQVWWRQAPIGKHISAPSSLDLQPPARGEVGEAAEPTFGHTDAVQIPSHQNTRCSWTRLALETTSTWRIRTRDGVLWTR
jgi:hypothetical protein